MHTLVPIFICAILPMSIVLIVFLTIMNSDNKRAKVLIKAIEANNNIDTDRLAEALQRPRKSSRENSTAGCSAAAYSHWPEYSSSQWASSISAWAPTSKPTL